MLPSGRIHISYVLPAGAAIEAVDDEDSLPVGAHYETSFACLETNGLRAWVCEHGRCGLRPLERRASVVELARDVRSPQPDPERDDRRDRSHGAEHGRKATPSRLERYDVLRRLRASVREDSLAQRWARRRT